MSTVTKTLKLPFLHLNRTKVEEFDRLQRLNTSVASGDRASVLQSKFPPKFKPLVHGDLRLRQHHFPIEREQSYLAKS